SFPITLRTFHFLTLLFKFLQIFPFRICKCFRNNIHSMYIRKSLSKFLAFQTIPSLRFFSHFNSFSITSSSKPNKPFILPRHKTQKASEDRLHSPSRVPFLR